MKAIELNVPDEVYEKLQGLASNDHQSVNAFALSKLEELTRACEAYGALENRARSGDPQKFKEAMAKVPHVPPMPGDALQ